MISSRLLLTTFLLSSVVTTTACRVSSDEAPEASPVVAVGIEPSASKRPSGPRAPGCQTDAECPRTADPCLVARCDKQAGAGTCGFAAVADEGACSAPPPAVCGDGLVSGGEVCDDGNQVTEALCAYGVAECFVCNSTCTSIVARTGGFCGDAMVNGPEVCDDGANTGACGSCSADCSAAAACP